MMRVVIKRNAERVNGQLIYRRRECSFDFLPDPSTLALLEKCSPDTSLMIRTLQLEVAAKSGRLLYAWGYYPLESVPVADLRIGDATSGTLFALSSSPLKAGVSMAMGTDADWTAARDLRTGWVCIRRYLRQSADLIEFASGCVAEIAAEELIAIWLKPVFE